jgi:hypothetical protein
VRLRVRVRVRMRVRVTLRVRVRVLGLGSWIRVRFFDTFEVSTRDALCDTVGNFIQSAPF